MIWDSSPYLQGVFIELYRIISTTYYSTSTLFDVTHLHLPFMTAGKALGQGHCQNQVCMGLLSPHAGPLHW
jgi:hypothetical protein